jgi:hypothetical protein
MSSPRKGWFRKLYLGVAYWYSRRAWCDSDKCQTWVDVDNGHNAAVLPNFFAYRHSKCGRMLSGLHVTDYVECPA